MRNYDDDIGYLDGELYESQEKIEELEREMESRERDREEREEEREKRDSKHSREVQILKNEIRSLKELIRKERSSKASIEERLDEIEREREEEGLDQLDEVIEWCRQEFRCPNEILVSQVQKHFEIGYAKSGRYVDYIKKYYSFG